MRAYWFWDRVIMVVGYVLVAAVLWVGLWGLNVALRHIDPPVPVHRCTQMDVDNPLVDC